MANQTDSIDAAAKYWSQHAGNRFIGVGHTWLEVPAVRERINRMVSGRPDVDLYQWTQQVLTARQRYCPLDAVLVLGCGAGNLERGLNRQNFAKSYRGVDVASGAIERAREEARQIGGTNSVIYDVADINTIELPPESYDAVFCPMSAHHFSNLEHVFAEVRKTLKPGGLFVLDEYIGPKQFQMPARQAKLIDRILKSLPRRWVETADGTVRRGFSPPTATEVIEVDPSEAIRSDEILPVLASSFAVTHFRGYGGNLLHFLLDKIGVNYVNQGDEESQDMLSTFFQIEDWALEEGLWTHDFASIIAERPEDLGVSPGYHDASSRHFGEAATQDRGADDVELLRQQIERLTNSRSWRITSPLRHIARLLRRA